MIHDEIDIFAMSLPGGTPKSTHSGCYCAHAINVVAVCPSVALFRRVLPEGQDKEFAVFLTKDA